MIKEIMGNKKMIWGLGLAMLVLVAVWRPWQQGGPEKGKYIVQKGAFDTRVSVPGQLVAHTYSEITIPEVSFNDELEIWALQIMSLVEEGTIVKKGEEIARLNPKEVNERIVEVQKLIDDNTISLEDAKIDSSLTLSATREAIQKAKDVLTDAKMKVDQSSFESRAIQRQAQIQYEKALRALDRARREVLVKRQQHKIIINRIEGKQKQLHHKIDLLDSLFRSLVITAPSEGMIVYGLGYDRQKVRVGSMVGKFMPVIATIPDLKSINSEMYVREIDISKVAVNQKVQVVADAFPNCILTGRVRSIANIGKELAGDFQKGFRVVVELTDYEVELLPGIGSVNNIITYTAQDALFIEKAAVQSDIDGDFVWVREGFKKVRREVRLGVENDRYYEILHGLEEGERVVDL